MIRRIPHRPAHVYRTDALYFVTARTLHAQPWFAPEPRRQALLEIIDWVAAEAGCPLYAWFVGQEHYHILLGAWRPGLPLDPLKGVRAAEGPVQRFDLGRFVNRIHSIAGCRLNKEDRTPGRRIFYQFWDRCIRSEGEMFATVNYIHHNPVKHGLMQTLDQAREYPYSSLRAFHARYGAEWVGECFARFPVADYTTMEGGEPD